MKQFIIFLVVIIIIALGIFGWFQGWFGGSTYTGDSPADEETEEENDTSTSTDEESGENGGDADSERQSVSTIGTSVEGRDIEAHHFGTGDEEVLFVGGIHGGYSWNTVSLAYELIDYLSDNSEAVPDNLAVTVIPVLNPDGLYETVGTAGRFQPSDVPAQLATVSGRFNANEVDLNRNFNCNWSSTGTWRDQSVDTGAKAFSEPETRALRDYVQGNDVRAAVVYYSAAGGVYSSSCDGAVTNQTQELMNTYATASGYPAEGKFEAYVVTGDAVDWLSSQNIPAVSVLLATHTQVEWSQNQRGIEAILEHYAR